VKNFISAADAEGNSMDIISELEVCAVDSP
jgi:hypothetical protein